MAIAFFKMRFSSSSFLYTVWKNTLDCSSYNVGVHFRNIGNFNFRFSRSVVSTKTITPSRAIAREIFCFKIFYFKLLN